MPKFPAPGRYLGPVRRIERVVPPPGGRVVALTFEDGPTAAPAKPEGRQGRWQGSGVTSILLDVLKAYHAKATFCVVGSAAEDQPALVRRMLDEGHELANHSYRHLPLHAFHADEAGALADMVLLHEHVRKRHGCVMRLGRPPHLVEGRAYEVFAGLGYQYLGMGVDGGGGRASSGSYDNDVEMTVLGLQRTLEKDGLTFCGRFVSLRDGHNQSGESPVVAALPRLAQLFRNYGYRVVTASELLEMSPFADLAPDHPAFPAAKDLLGRGWWVASRANEVAAERPLLRGELAVWALGPGVAAAASEAAAAAATVVPVPAAIGAEVAPAGMAVYTDIPVEHPYRGHVEAATGQGLWRGVAGTSGRPSPPEARGSRVFGPWDPVGAGEFAEVLGRAGVNVAAGSLRGVITRGQALMMISEALAGADREGGETGLG